MKYIILILVAVFVVSCSENPVNSPSTGNPPVSGDSLIFSIDSIVFRSDSTFQTMFWSHNLQINDSLKITFTGISDCDSSNFSYFVIGLYQLPNYFNPVWFAYTEMFKTQHTIHLSPDAPQNILFAVDFWNFSNQEKFIILKNVKIYKVRPQ